MLTSLFNLGPALLGDIPPEARPWWLDSFQQKTFQHFLPAGLGLLAMAASTGLGVRWRGTPKEPRVRLGFGVPALLYAILVSIWYVIPPQLNWARSLPLHLCDLAVLLAPATLIWQQRWMRGLLFYWGIGLSTQAFITPTVLVGLGDAEYYFFWTSHVVIVGSAVYDYVAGGFRPGLKDFATSVAISLSWGACVTVVNLRIKGANYGYIADVTPQKPTIIDSLGPWPDRVFILIAIVIGAFAVLTALSMAVERLDKRMGVWPSRVVLGVLWIVGGVMMALGLREIL